LAFASGLGHSIKLENCLQGEERAHGGKDRRHSGGGRALAAIDVDDFVLAVSDELGEQIVNPRERVGASNKVLAQVRATLVVARVRDILHIIRGGYYNGKRQRIQRELGLGIDGPVTDTSCGTRT